MMTNITTITRTQERLDRLQNVRQTFINTEDWLRNYNIIPNNNIPVARRFLGNEVLDREGIININQSIETRDNFINSLLNNNRNIYINNNTNELSENFINYIQNIAYNNENLNTSIISILLNTPGLKDLVEKLINDLNNNTNNENRELITHFMNSFLTYLTSRRMDSLINVLDFDETMRDIAELIQTSFVIDSNIENVNQTNESIRISLDEHITTAQNLININQEALNRDFNETISSEEIRNEEDLLKSIINNNEITEESNDNIKNICDQKKDELDKTNEESHNKILKILYKKKIILGLIGIIIATQTGYTLPITSLINLYNRNNNIENSNDLIRFRDVIDVLTKKAYIYAKTL